MYHEYYFASGGSSWPGRTLRSGRGAGFVRFASEFAKLIRVCFSKVERVRYDDYSTSTGGQDARQFSSTAARHIAHTRIRQHAIAVARLQRRGGGQCSPTRNVSQCPARHGSDSLPAALWSVQQHSAPRLGTRELEPSGSLAHGRRGCRATSAWRRGARARGRAAASHAWAAGVETSRVSHSVRSSPRLRRRRGGRISHAGTINWLDWLQECCNHSSYRY